MTQLEIPEGAAAQPEEVIPTNFLLLWRPLMQKYRQMSQQWKKQPVRLKEACSVS
jgi:hypothetical protein